MKILIVGAWSEYAIEKFYVKHLKADASLEIEFFAAQNQFLNYYKKSLLHKILFRLGYKKIYIEINNSLKNKVLEFCPSVILVFKGMEIMPATLKWARKRNIFLINYNPDNPFIFTGRGSGNKNVTDSVGLFDLHITYNRKTEYEIISRYRIKTLYLPFGFEVSEEVFQYCKSQEEKVKLCFLGNPDKQRTTFISELLKRGVEIDVYGHGWDKFIIHPGCTIYPAVFGDEYWKVLSRYRVQLNIMRIHNEDSHNMRSFEIPGIGGVMLAPRTQEHVTFFKDGEDAFFYSTIDECIILINRLLSMAQHNIETIRKNARETSLKNGYTYSDRAVFLISQIKNVKMDTKRNEW